MTQDELIGTSDHVPINIWTVIFLEEQGYEIKKNIIFEDNHITIRMAKNGRWSCIVNSSHILILHFFVKDGVDKGEIYFKYCPNHLMIADYF